MKADKTGVTRQVKVFAKNLRDEQRDYIKRLKKDKQTAKKHIKAAEIVLEEYEFTLNALQGLDNLLILK